MRLVILIVVMQALAACETNPSSEQRIIIPVWELDR